jgi:hypothetical protein
MRGIAAMVVCALLAGCGAVTWRGDNRFESSRHYRATLLACEKHALDARQQGHSSSFDYIVTKCMTGNGYY